MGARMKRVLVSGGFDPVHIGHVRLFQEARKIAGKNGKLIVLLNNDNWLKKKKGYAFYPQEERYAILKALAGIDIVYLTFHKEDTHDMSVCQELRTLQPDIFVKGGDRTKDNTPEAELCKHLGIKVYYDVGGGKIQSSSDAVKRAYHELQKMENPEIEA